MSAVDEVAVEKADVLRTRVTLAGMQARQDRIRDSLNRSGLASTVDRLDFLIAQRSADEVLAWNRHWTGLGVVRPAPQPEVFARPVSLSVPSSYKPKRRKRSIPVIAPDRQLEIALAVMAAKEAREGGTERAA